MDMDIGPIGKKSENYLICHTCFQQREKVDVLACLHNICDLCSGEGLRRKITPTCSICTPIFGLPVRNGAKVDDVGLVSRFKNAVSMATILCILCHGSDVEQFCVDCQSSFCSNCATKHRGRSSTRDHQIVSLYNNDFEVAPIQYQKSHTVALCPKHPSYELSFLCDTCNEPVCLQCASTIHTEPHHSCRYAVSTEYGSHPGRQGGPHLDATDHGGTKRKEIYLDEGQEVLLKIVLVGNIGVGKTALMDRYIRNKFEPPGKMTLGVNVGVKIVEIEGFLIKLQIWEIAGLEKCGSDLSQSYFKDTNGCILVFDVNNQASYYALERLRDECLIYSGCKDFIVIGNKADISNRREVSVETVERWCKSENMTYFETSAAFENDKMLDAAFLSLAKTALSHGYRVRKKHLEDENDSE